MLKFLPVKNPHLSKGEKIDVGNLNNVLRKMGLMLSDNVYKELQHALSVYSEY